MKKSLSTQGHALGGHNGPVLSGKVMGVIIIIVAIATGFSGCGNSQKLKVESQKSVEQQVKNSEQQVQVVGQDKKEELKNEQKAEELKVEKEKDLVWYEIPKLNIKFKTTQWMKDSLIYKKVGNVVYLCDKNVLKFLNDNTNYSFDMSNGEINYEKYIKEYAQGHIYITSKEKIKQAQNRGDKVCGDTQIVGFINQEELICFIGRQDSLIPENLINKYIQTVGENYIGVSKYLIRKNLQKIK